ncbi:MAG: DUF2461 domain-containing protein [Dysgonamonadaceae bacterium]|jgi:uncharacterized protein (TIGR02453 family)|nr:DUF2461 domain-containing protein [Dysgonamonadaceae bacterium]
MKANTVFAGFSQELFQFFRDLKENNSKPWFDEHKSTYTNIVLAPMKSFCTALSPAFYTIDPKINMNPTKVVSRIYRDIRFSKDKTPYRTNMWMNFQRIRTDWLNFPGYYLELNENNYQYGMGIYLATRNEMDTFRSRVKYDPDTFKKMTRNLLTKHSYVIGGELYKRPLQNNLPEYFQQWIQRKSIYIYKDQPIGNELFHHDFVEHIANEYQLLKPLYEYFVDICE